MTLLFLDSEFNEFGGELISMALVDEKRDFWYQVAAIPEKPGAFVAEHVLPKLDKAPIGAEAFSLSLQTFLFHYPKCEIIADWPADFEHLCTAMSGMGMRGGWRLPIECTMRLVVTPELHPVSPHNALSDAFALRDWYLAGAA
jgi:hypothetical protein